MKLYVCWNARRGPLGHPCGDAYHALREAGYEPEVIKSYGHFVLPDLLNRSEGRRVAKRLTGQSKVPVLVTDDGDAVWDSKQIVEWARQHPAQTHSDTTTGESA
jgi:hypothetical protein